MPAWPGRDRYTGRLVHSTAYSNASPYAGQRVLVVLLLSALPAAIANRLGMVTARSALTCRMPSTSRGSLRGHLFEARRASLRLAGHIERYLR
jgi:hypothetical protein